MTLASYVNIATYKFVRLDNLKERRRSLRKQCVRWGLKGTILLSTEGINLFVAGQRQSIDKLLTWLREDPAFNDLDIKESLSDNQPFNRMLVRIKKEIIAFGIEGIDPLQQPAPKLEPRELKQWLDEGRAVTLLDTRNQYEIRLGTFRNAVPIGIDHFREFPDAVSRLPDDWKQRPVVMFCTGGIRCEKAGPLMLREGFQQIYQLHGGILKYFEECGGEHFQGECFVFDQRVAVDSKLAKTATTQCYACQEPLTAAEQLSEKYVPGESCPYCYRGPAEQLAITIEQRHAALRRLTDPLPGSRPYENRRPIRVPQRFDGMTLLDFLAGCLPHIPRDQWQGVCERGEMLGDAGRVLAAHIVRAARHNRARGQRRHADPVRRCVDHRLEQTGASADASQRKVPSQHRVAHHERVVSAASAARRASPGRQHDRCRGPEPHPPRGRPLAAAIRATRGTQVVSGSQRGAASG